MLHHNIKIIPTTYVYTCAQYINDDVRISIDMYHKNERAICTKL